MTLKSLGTSGLSRTEMDFSYRVDGSQDPSMFNPIFGFTLTVEVSFTSNGSPVEPGSWSNKTLLSLSKDSSTTKLKGTISGNVMLFTAACSTGDYRVEVSCPGFETYSQEKTIDSMEKISIELPMIQYSVTVSSPVDSRSGTVFWNVASTDDFDSIILGVVGTSQSNVWFRSSGAGYVHLLEKAPAVGMFDDNRKLYIVGVPSLDGTDPTFDPVPGIIVVASEGSVDGTYVVKVVEGVDGPIDLTGTFVGSEVTIRYYIDDSEAKLSISGFPDGTGAWTVSGSGLSVTIVVISDLEGRT